MAIPSYLSNDLDKDINTFGDWFERTRSLSNDMGSKALTAELSSSGGSTTGNTSLIGIFSANTIAVGSELRGGTVETPGTLNIVSNTNVTSVSSAFTNTNHTIASNTYVLSSNTISSTSNTLSYSSGSIAFNSSGDTTLTAENVDITAVNVNLTGNTAFSASQATIDVLVIDQSISGEFSIIDPVSFNSSVTIDSNEFIKLPVGSTAQRPDTPVNGMIRFNNETTNFEGYNGSQWGSIGGELPIQNDTTDTTRYIGFFESTSGSANNVLVSSSKLQFNPSSGSLSATDFNSLSDITYKTDIQAIPDVEDIIERINTYLFAWKQTGKKSYGVLAQELESVLPELINESNGVKYVNYTPLIAILLEGHKKLKKQVSILEKANSSQTKENEDGN